MARTKQHSGKIADFRALTLHGGATGKLAEQAYVLPKKGDVVVVDVKPSLERKSYKIVKVDTEKALRRIKGYEFLYKERARRYSKRTVEPDTPVLGDPQATLLRSDAFDDVLSQIERPADPSAISREQVARHRLWRR